jgi:Raf kinase inhibitor-like YbhB/YbcL family protein
VRLHLITAALCITVLAALAADVAAAGKFTLTSPAFPVGGKIPPKYTCDGADAIVPLAWSSAPAGTKSFALIVDDPDTPIGTFLHRIAWGIPGTAKALAGKAPVEGANGLGRTGWMGPCPPSGTHRYVFRLYALKSALPLKTGADLDALETALKGRTLGLAKLIGKYSRS